MGKHREKVADARDVRIDNVPSPSTTPGMKFHKPGSLNRKKGYRRKAYKKV